VALLLTQWPQDVDGSQSRTKLLLFEVRARRNRYRAESPSPKDTRRATHSKVVHQSRPVPASRRLDGHRKWRINTRLSCTGTRRLQKAAAAGGFVTRRRVVATAASSEREGWAHSSFEKLAHFLNNCDNRVKGDSFEQFHCHHWPQCNVRRCPQPMEAKSRAPSTTNVAWFQYFLV
jgi:hypothetical protein